MNLVARTGEELSRLVWAGAWRRWFGAHPAWRMERPEVVGNTVRLAASSSAGTVSLRLRDNAGRLEVEVDPGAEPEAGPALVSRVEALVASGLRWERPAQRLELFIASGCNLHCAFCCESARIRERSFMPWATLEARLARAATDGVSVIQFMGGEATIHPQFVEAARRARALGMRTFVITNLLRWESLEFAEAVAPWLDEVMVSVHAVGGALGAEVTGRESWWDRFQVAARNARATLRGRVRCSTVLHRANAAVLEQIADEVLAFGPHAWVMGNAVPIPDARSDVIGAGLRLDELRAMRPRLEALHARAAEAGCALVFFCFPHCVLGPALWESSHDAYVDRQDLSDDAPTEVNFWSQADYLTAPRAVTLARMRPEACKACARRDRCGGYFIEYFQRFGSGELTPVAEAL